MCFPSRNKPLLHCTCRRCISLVTRKFVPCRARLVAHRSCYWTQAQHTAFRGYICWTSSAELELLGWATLERGWQLLMLLPLQLTPCAKWHHATMGSGHHSRVGVGQPILLFFCNSTRVSLPCPMSFHSGGPQGKHTFGIDSSVGCSSSGFSLGTRRHMRGMQCWGAVRLKPK